MSQEQPQHCFKNSWQSSKRMFYVLLKTGVKEQRHLLQKGTEILWYQWVNWGKRFRYFSYKVSQGTLPSLLSFLPPPPESHGKHFLSWRPGIISAASDFSWNLASSGTGSQSCKAAGRRGLIWRIGWDQSLEVHPLRSRQKRSASS